MRTICIHVTLRNSTKSPSEHDEKQKSSQSGRQREIARFGINAHQHLSVGLQIQIQIKIKILQESGESIYYYCFIKSRLLSDQGRRTLC